MGCCRFDDADVVKSKAGQQIKVAERVWLDDSDVARLSTIPLRDYYAVPICPAEDISACGVNFGPVLDIAVGFRVDLIEVNVQHGSGLAQRHH